MDMNNMVFEIKDYTVVRNGYRTTEKRLDTIQECIDYIRKNMKKTYTNNVNLSYWIVKNYVDYTIAPVLLIEITSFAGLDAYEKVEQEKAEQEKARLEAEQEKEYTEQVNEKYFTVVKDGATLTRENNFQDCINFIRDDVEKNNATTFEYIVKMHHNIIKVVAVVDKDNLFIYRDTRGKTIKRNSVIKDVFVVNDKNIYSNINDALNDGAKEKCIDYYTMPYWTTGQSMKKIDKKRWIYHCYMLVFDGELVAFELNENNTINARHDISLIRQLVFFARSLKAGANIREDLKKEYKKRIIDAQD